MKKLDGCSIPEGPQEIRVFAAVRNEALRLPSWLRHYRSLGADRFFVVDNGSSDGTVELLLDEPDVHLFQTLESFHESRYGSLWFRSLMAEHGVDRWCVVADADELLAPPYWESVSLQQVARALDQEGSQALPCLLLDMYGSSPVKKSVLGPADDPLDLFPFFDPHFETKEANFIEAGVKHSISTFIGGTRRKVFGINPFLSKIGMVRYHPGMILTSGQHAILGARESGTRGVMFHFKFLSDFVEGSALELERDERRTHTHEWVAYAHAFQANPSLTLFDERSVRLEGTDQLLRLGIMQMSPGYASTAGVGTYRPSEG